MASTSIRLRRTLRALSGLHRSLSATCAPPSKIHSPLSTLPRLQIQSRSFRSSPIWLLSSRSSNIPDEIGPDTILFEGCDYNHWLFVMDFPKDNKPSPEDMVRTYEETCAKGLNISVEEAKKKIYACSTTTYTGFQAIMTEEESKKFEGLPGVIFVLPDSYIDPVNKQYGGDQYMNGTIIPRPPPIQYGRNQGRRDRNRTPGQYNRQDNPMPNPQGQYNRGPMQWDGRNYGPQQNYGQPSQNYPPHQNYGQPSQTQQNYAQASPNHPPRQNYGQASQNYPQQQRYGPSSPQYAQQQSCGSPGQGERRNFVPQQNFGLPGQGEGRDQVPRHAGTGASEPWNDTFTPSYTKDFKPSYMEEFEKAEQGNYPAKEQTGSQQRYPPPGQSDFTGEGRY